MLVLHTVTLLFLEVNYEKKYENLSEELMKPEIVGDQEQYKKLMREYKVLTPIIEKFRELSPQNPLVYQMKLL